MTSCYFCCCTVCGESQRHETLITVDSREEGKLHRFSCYKTSPKQGSKVISITKGFQFYHFLALFESISISIFLILRRYRHDETPWKRQSQTSTGDVFGGVCRHVLVIHDMPLVFISCEVPDGITSLKEGCCCYNFGTNLDGRLFCSNCFDNGNQNCAKKDSYHQEAIFQGCCFNVSCCYCCSSIRRHSACGVVEPTIIQQ